MLRPGPSCPRACWHNGGSPRRFLCGSQGGGGQAGRAPRRAKSSTRAGKAWKAGWVAKLCTAGVVAQGSFSRVQKSAKGRNQPWSSSRMARRFTISSSPSGRVNIQLLHQGQKKCRVGPCSPPIAGSPDVTANPALGTARGRASALAVIRWPPVPDQTDGAEGKRLSVHVDLGGHRLF